jgi:hypothetical protein
MVCLALANGFGQWREEVAGRAAAAVEVEATLVVQRDLDLRYVKPVVGSTLADGKTKLEDGAVLL